MRRVVVTGMGVISPVGNSTAAFWDSLKAGRCGIEHITKFDTSAFKVKVAAQVKEFHPEAFMDKKEIRKTDLFTQFALGAATEAMGQSGLNAAEGQASPVNIDPRRLGVYIGSGTGGMGTIFQQCGEYYANGPRRVSPFFIPAMILNIAAGNVAMRFNAQGPCLPVATACATATHAIGEAFRAIKHGYADAVLAGGSEAAINPMAVAGFTNCKALSLREDPLDCCTPFDARRDGFVMGEGAGVLVLEEYSHAKKRGAKIYGEITGYGNTCDAYHVTAPHPQALGASRAIELAMEEAGITGKEPLYINAHGTGTPLNDSCETLAIKNALGPNVSGVLVSSTKSMTGHMLGAAGAVEAIAAILALKEGLVPPTIGYRVPDPACDLDYVPNTARRASVEAALSLSLGFGGHNGVLAFGKINE